METLEARIGYTFHDRRLLQNALMHSSYANENRARGCTSNERLEFLGDSVLGMVTAMRLYRLYPDMPEGKLSRLRAELVCEQSLHAVALELGLGSYIRLGHGEARNGGRERPSILADAVEAIIAAIYLDGGLESAQRFILDHILTGLAEGQMHHVADYKTDLQERVQRKPGQALEYTLLSESGPDHNKSFTMNVLLNGSEIGRGTGRTKKEAEQSAAKSALERMGS
ncbi:MAG: ribonuclease III [Oscillospiraceae bacterium]|nr:ribonuclease III [Clostridiales bacterium]MDY2960962.1 ribonuclease III [Oscillospiraceae bacterium]MDD6077720.1 ribonuclease III [Clostridiales bacterium]MDD6107088.1 ribonuclease III [Clostridiales bacterium]MDD6935323.1 ribonuclease III [Clostridiales bacterium]